MTTDAPRFETLPIDWIEPHPRNVRADVGDVSTLAASIAAEGILEPLVVAPIEDTDDPDQQPGAYLLIAGHRRLAAAQVACLDEVPCMIHPGLTGEADQLLAMLNENGHRADLTAVEESKAYQALLEFDGIDAATIATRTGHRKKYVTDRIALGKAPASVVDKVAAGDATLTDALTIASYTAKHPGLAADLEKAAGTSAWSYTVARAEAAKKHAATQAAAVKALRAAGVTVLVETDPADRAESDAHRTRKARELGQDLLAAHVTRTVIAAGSDPEIIAGATDPDTLIFATLAGPYTATIQWKQLIPDTAAADKAAAEAAAEQEAAAAAAREKARNDLHAAATVRRKFLADGLRGDVDDIARAILIEDLGIALDSTDGADDLTLIAGYLGIAIAEPTEVDDIDWDAVTAQILDKAAGLRIDQVVVLLRLVERAGDEDRLTDAAMWLPPEPYQEFRQRGPKRWRRELAELFGYEWTEPEAALIDALDDTTGE